MPGALVPPRRPRRNPSIGRAEPGEAASEAAIGAAGMQVGQQAVGGALQHGVAALFENADGDSLIHDVVFRKENIQQAICRGGWCVARAGINMRRPRLSSLAKRPRLQPS